MINVVLYHCCLYILITIAYTVSAYSSDIPSVYMKVEITEITYIGDDNYKIETTLMNNSNKNILIKEIKKQFYAQSEILGRWISLDIEADSTFFERSNIYIKPDRYQKFVAVVQLPLDIPRLYLNGFGDLNLKLRYQVHFTINDKSMIYKQSDESSYWITPRSDKWVLREGM